MSNYSVDIHYSGEKEYEIILGELGMKSVTFVGNTVVKIYFKTLYEIMPFVNRILEKLGRPLGHYDVWDVAFQCWQRKIEPDSESEDEGETQSDC